MPGLRRNDESSGFRAFASSSRLIHQVHRNQECTCLLTPLCGLRAILFFFLFAQAFAKHGSKPDSLPGERF
jgi:hypothetical protein